MALQTKNWAVNSYTNATWTDLVAEPATIATLVVSSGATLVKIQVRVSDGGVGVFTLIPMSDVALNETYTLDIRSLNLTGTQKLQFQVDVAGAEFFASGVVEV